ncbi:hypothetical protein AMTRI_Chr03g50890 [Amborella trichopoda]
MAEDPQIVAEEDDEHESKEIVVRKYFLQEWIVLKSIIDDIIENGGSTDPASINKARSIMDKYQEQGQLLEPYLERIVSPLMHIIRLKTLDLGAASDQNLELVKPLCIILYTLVNVCGYKAVTKFFPHQVSDLELAVSLLAKCHHDTAATSLRQESTGEMETKCIILLWLSILVLIPFDISSVDTSLAECPHNGDLGPSPLVQKMFGFSKDYLSNAGPMRKIAGLLLSRLLTRPDMPKIFNSFIQWTDEVLSSFSDDVADIFILLGILEALAAIFKVGSKKLLLDTVPIIWKNISILVKSSIGARSSLLRKFLMKLTQRLGLACLPHRAISRRYVGRHSSLGKNLSLNVDDERDSYGSAQVKKDECIEEEEMDVPEVVEEIIEQLLTGLRDTDTVVRWSAAKGIGRITGRLTAALSDEVLSSILELFSPGEGDGSWHGGCLALAELARRGLLLPVSLPRVVPVIVKALHYDVRRGPHSVGSHVRDAAAYVCWAFGRAYYHADMKSILEQLAPHLLTVACYDREVNCRRAAAAAFQENVGRQGSFPHGIDIVNAADYFSLSSRVNSYLQVAVFIAQYTEYLHVFVDELLTYKICHWDKGLRELAAAALSALVKYEPGYFCDFVLDKLIPCTLSLDLNMRHGATLAVAEIVLALHQCGAMLSIEKQNRISGIVPAIEKARLYRGKGGEIMRSCVSRLIECTSLSNASLPEKTKRTLLETLNENLKHPNAQIQGSAAQALKYFIKAYISMSDKLGQDLMSKYLALLDDPNMAARRGAALAISVFPYELLVRNWAVVLDKLCPSCMIQENPDDRDAEACVNAVRGLVSVCETLTGTGRSPVLDGIEGAKSLDRFIKNQVFDTLFKALDDYSVDNRGDVGSWVREAAMEGLEKCTYILCEMQSMGVGSLIADVAESTPALCDSSLGSNNEDHPLFDANIATMLIGGIVKQAVEKIDKIRETAGKILQRILYSKEPFVPCIVHRDKLEAIIPNSENLNWGAPNVSYPRMVHLLQFPCYSKAFLSGLVISVGGLADSLRKASLAALLEYLEVSELDNCERKIEKDHMLCNDLLWVLQQYRKCDRVIIPTLKTIEILLNKMSFLQVEGFLAGVLDSLAVELKGTKDFTKLYTGISILGCIASLEDSINSHAFSQLASFLVHRYPKIRKACADQVYLLLLQNGSQMMEEDKLDEALTIILETCWEGGLEEAKLQRLRFSEIAHLQDQTVEVEPRKKVDKAEKMAMLDENESYSSLVGSTGF